MGRRQVSRRLYFGKWHRICPYCGIWFPAGKGSHKSNCSVCGSDIEYCRRNNLSPPKKQYNPYIDYDVADIEAELRGEIPIKDLFKSCSAEKIAALKEGSVIKLLRAKD